MRPTHRISAVIVFALSVTFLLSGETPVGPEQAADLYAEAFELLEIEGQERWIVFGGEDGELSQTTRERIQQGVDILSRAATAKSVA